MGDLKEVADLPDGSPLWRYRIRLERTVELREVGTITVVTTSPPDKLQDRIDEIWDLADDEHVLHESGHWLHRDESKHKELVESATKIVKRCPFTAEMFAVSPSALRDTET